MCNRGDKELQFLATEVRVTTARYLVDPTYSFWSAEMAKALKAYETRFRQLIEETGRNQ